MKKAVLLLALCGLLATPSWGGGLGLFYSHWDADDAGSGSGAGVKLEFDMNDRIDLEFRVSNYTDLETEAEPRVFRVEANPIEIGLVYNFRPGEKVNPFLGGGVGLYNFKADQRAEVDTEAGWYGVFGLEFPVHRSWKLVLEGMYRQVQAEIQGDDLGTFTDQAFELAGLTANLGLLYSW